MTLTLKAPLDQRARPIDAAYTALQHNISRSMKRNILQAGRTRMGRLPTGTPVWYIRDNMCWAEMHNAR